MLVTELGITVFLAPTFRVLLDVSMMALQLFRESYTLFPLSTVMKYKSLQTPNLLRCLMEWDQPGSKRYGRNYLLILILIAPIGIHQKSLSNRCVKLGA